MTDIAFHFGVVDKLGYTCRLLRKAVSGGFRVMVVGAPHVLGEVDAGLWALAPTDFIAQCDDSADVFARKSSAVVLGSAVDPLLSSPDVLVNLWDVPPDGFEKFGRVIEVVSTEDMDRQAARQRWKFYTERGYDITRHDLASKGGG